MGNVIILCSGGLDSVTTAHYLKKKLNYNQGIILFFNYGQRALIKERFCSRKCAEELDYKFQEIKLPELSKLSSSLINIRKKAKKLSRKDLKNTKKESMNFYVPFRNSIFIAYALALAESSFIKEKKIYEIFLGFKNEGAENYPDTTEKYVKEINNLMKVATNGKFKIKAPLIKKDKEEIVKLGAKLNVNFKNTHSCYVSNKSCGSCLACMLRKEGFYWSGIKNPTEY